MIPAVVVVVVVVVVIATAVDVDVSADQFSTPFAHMTVIRWFDSLPEISTAGAVDDLEDCCCW